MIDEPKTYELYEVYVDTGEANKKFKEFCQSLGRAVEVNWKDTFEA